MAPRMVMGSDIAESADLAIALRWQDDATPFAGPTPARSLVPHEAWRDRMLAPRYAMLFFDALRLQLRQGGTMRQHRAYPVLGIRTDGRKEIIALGITGSPHNDFWRHLIGDLKRRGLSDTLIAVTDGSEGIATRLHEAFPNADCLTGISHLLEQSLRPVPAKERRVLAGILAGMTSANDTMMAATRLAQFSVGAHGRRHPSVSSFWHRHWHEVESHFALPATMRTLIRTNGATKSIGAKWRRQETRARTHFADSVDATRHLSSLLQAASTDWKVSPRQWLAAHEDFVHRYGHRFTAGVFD